MNWISSQSCQECLAVGAWLFTWLLDYLARDSDFTHVHLVVRYDLSVRNGYAASRQMISIHERGSYKCVILKKKY